MTNTLIGRAFLLLPSLLLVAPLAACSGAGTSSPESEELSTTALAAQPLQQVPASKQACGPGTPAILRRYFVASRQPACTTVGNLRGAWYGQRIVSGMSSGMCSYVWGGTSAPSEEDRDLLDPIALSPSLESVFPDCTPSAPRACSLGTGACEEAQVSRKIHSPIVLAGTFGCPKCAVRVGPSAFVILPPEAAQGLVYISPDTTFARSVLFDPQGQQLVEVRPTTNVASAVFGDLPSGSTLHVAPVPR